MPESTPNSRPRNSTPLALKGFVSFLLACCIKLLSQLFFKIETSWVEEPPEDGWKNIRVMALLHHTSLFEPLFIGSFPYSYIWDACHRVVVPVADKTINRPIVGLFFKLLIPRLIAISRRRDFTWTEFMDKVDDDALIGMLPEGRMMRVGGLDSQGRPMTVRGGIGEVLLKLRKGKMLVIYSGGLHHIQAPGEKRIGLFKTIKLKFELIDIEEYIKPFTIEKPGLFRLQVAREMQTRRDQHRP